MGFIIDAFQLSDQNDPLNMPNTPKYVAELLLTMFLTILPNLTSVSSMVIAHKMANVGYSRCKNGEKWQKMVSKHAPIRAPNDRNVDRPRSTNIVPYDLRYTVGLYVGIHSKYFKPQLVSKIFSAHFDPNQCRSVNFTTLSFMNDGNISQIWTHIFKGGLLVVDGCAYFN